MYLTDREDGHLPHVLLWLAYAVLVIGLPLLGVWTHGAALGPYLAFPWRTSEVTPGNFSWPVFLLLTAVIIAAVAPFCLTILRTRPASRVSDHGARFPRWGWLGVVLLLTAWWLAWHRYTWFAGLQPLTFTPIWLGYIVLVNALTRRRAGESMLTHRTGFFLGLFPVSAVFWWFFEYLNQFVDNWAYVGVVGFGAREYILNSTLAFSTVLPAVLGTYGFLRTLPWLQAGLGDARRIPAVGSRIVHWVLLGLAVMALAAIAVWPDVLFPMLWLAPLMLIIGLLGITRRATLLSPLAEGDWRGLWLLALAGLMCGFLWELWNSRSLAHWEYAVPYVQGFKLFEMPVLGYAGYLPFGITCAAIADMVLGRGPTGNTSGFR